jgi:sugar phosphate isomerase/epimerase
LKDFLKDFNKKTVSVNYDMGDSAYHSFDVKEEFLSYGHLISNVHIKDCTPENYTVQLGTGNVDFDKVFQLLKDNDYTQDFILQAARGKDDVQTANNQLNFVKTYISKYFK